MSVNVVRPRPTPDDRTSTGTDQYEKAGCVTVQNGHLQVKISGVNLARDLVAVYAPGQWLYATTDGETIAA